MPHPTLVLVNARSGTVLDVGAEAVKRLLEEGFAKAGKEVEVRLLGRELGTAIDNLGNEPFERIVIGGGDGSVHRALQTLVGTGKTLGVLPLGTMNLLASDLGIRPPLPQAIERLAAGEPRSIDLGLVNGRPFHTLSGLGFFSQMARAREEARKSPLRLGRFLDVARAAWRAFSRSGRITLEVEVDGVVRDVDAVAVLVTNNRVDGGGWRRQRLDGGLLEVHVAHDRSVLARLKAGADMAAGTWRNNPTIDAFAGERIVIRSRRTRCWLATDGELEREPTPIIYQIKPRAITVLG